MLIDWFTVAAQIVNFLILVLLLKRFLYGPIVQAMQEREQRVRSRLQQAAESRQIAQQEGDRYRRQQQELAAQREALLATARREAEASRRILLREAKAEVDAARSQWELGLQRDRQTLARQVSQHAGRQLIEVARRTLQDLADVDLEHHITDTFIGKLERLPDPEQSALRTTLAADPQPQIVIQSAFALPDGQRDRLIVSIRQLWGERPAIQFEQSPDPIAGIELTTSGYHIAWTVAGYLEDLELNIQRAISTNGNGAIAQHSKTETSSPNPQIPTG